MRLDIVTQKPRIIMQKDPYSTGMSFAASFNVETDNPTDHEITTAVEEVYAENIDAVILLSDVDNNQFIQLPCGGRHIEYCIGPHGPVYSAEDIPLLTAQLLFLSYVRCDGEFLTRIAWMVEIEHLD